MKTKPAYFKKKNARLWREVKNPQSGVCENNAHCPGGYRGSRDDCLTAPPPDPPESNVGRYCLCCWRCEINAHFCWCPFCGAPRAVRATQHWIRGVRGAPGTIAHKKRMSVIFANTGTRTCAFKENTRTACVYPHENHLPLLGSRVCFAPF